MKYLILSSERVVEIKNYESLRLIKDKDASKQVGPLKINDKVWLNGSLCLKVIYRDSEDMIFKRVD